MEDAIGSGNNSDISESLCKVLTKSLLAYDDLSDALYWEVSIATVVPLIKNFRNVTHYHYFITFQPAYLLYCHVSEISTLIRRVLIGVALSGHLHFKSLFIDI